MMMLLMMMSMSNYRRSLGRRRGPNSQANHQVGDEDRTLGWTSVSNDDARSTDVDNDDVDDDGSPQLQ
jgi:hypothetical protein